MPKLMDPNMEVATIGGLQQFKFSGVRTEHLGATEYTLVTIATDSTGSVSGFEADLRKAEITAVEACKKSPRSNNLLLRLVRFSTSFPSGIEEIHGFKPLSEIDTATYPAVVPQGMTPLYDAAFSAVGATNVYAEKLNADEYLSNGIVFIITDGDDNESRSTPAMIRKEIEKAVKGEHIESLITVLVGINATAFQQRLEEFGRDTGLKYIDVGDVTKGKLAKLADFVSQSVSSQSQALGTGGPSQSIAATI
ncbi:hypothetical protein HY413_01995 [Candidatus Kaiserbacteria bacterium]|nr:hypothetical protein [Candidatus Kaiserbacteria bacterium]